MSIKQNSRILLNLLWPNTIVGIDSSNPNFSQMRNYSILSSFLPKALIACINMACSLLHCTCNIKDQEEHRHGLQSSQGPLGPKYCEEGRVGSHQWKSKCNIMSMVLVLSLLSFFTFAVVLIILFLDLASPKSKLQFWHPLTASFNWFALQGFGCGLMKVIFSPLSLLSSL